MSLSALSHSSYCDDVLGVSGGRVYGMAFDGGGGVAEGFGDDGHRCEFGELVEGTESCGPGAEQLTEARCVLGRDAVRSRPGFAASSVPDSVTGIAPTPRQAGEKGWLLNRCKRDDKPLAPVELHVRVRRATGIGLFSCHADQFLSNRVVVSCHGFILSYELSIVNNLQCRLNRPWYPAVLVGRTVGA
jgi:hypothetical protein